jgi:hypothetical protein
MEDLVAEQDLGLYLNQEVLEILHQQLHHKAIMVELQLAAVVVAVEEQALVEDQSMELLEEMAVQEHRHTHLGHRQHQLVEEVLMQEAAVEEQHKFSIQQQLVLVVEALVDGD